MPMKCSVCKWETKSGRKVDTSQSMDAWADELEVHRTTISRHLGHAATLPSSVGAASTSAAPVSAGYSHDVASDGTVAITKRADRVIPLSEWIADLKADGFDPDHFSFSIGHSVWGQQQREEGLITLYANRFTATLKTPKERAEADSPLVLESILESIRGFQFIPAERAVQAVSSVVVPADLQIGKVDVRGGSKETVEQALASFHAFAAICREVRPAEIVMVDAGDIIENIYSTSSQLGTNDLDLPHQIEVASHVMLEGIKILAPLAPSLRYAAVSSNHGQHRIGPKSPGGDAHADYGIVIAKMIGRSLELNEPAFGHVTVQTPEPYMESLAFETSGSTIGVVHSHQAGNVDKIGDWWKGQSHGGMPTAAARILLAGHWHSLRVQQSGDGRWIFVGPSSDRGSTWFTNLRGESSQSGMLTFLTADNNWSDLHIL